MRMRCTSSKAVVFLCFLFGLLFVNFGYGQSVPYGFSYQAIVRDGLGLPVVNSSTTIRLTLLQGGPSGTVVWQEVHTSTTNQFGLVNLVVGAGTREAGTAVTFSDINWAAGQTFIRVELLQGSNIIDLGTAPFQSVPYALASDNALRIQNVRVSSAVPTDGQFLTYNAISGFWEPKNLAGANGGTVISVSGTGPIQILGNAGLSPVVGILQSSDSQDGYLSSIDWSIFNSKLDMNSVAGGDLSGTFGNLTVNKIRNQPVSSTAPSLGQILTWDGTEWVPSPLTVSGLVTSITGTFPVLISGTPESPGISVATVTNVSDGVLKASDYISFLNKLGPTTAFGGDVTGTFNNLTVGSITGIPVNASGALANQVLMFNGTAFVPQNIPTSVFQPTTSGTSFTSDNIAIGTTTVGGAKLRVAGDISAGGMVVASSTMQPTGTASATYKTLYRQRIYIPSGTVFLDGSINVYKYLPTGIGTLEIAVGPQTVVVAASTDDPTASEPIPPINVSSLAGTYQTLEIRGVADLLSEGIVVSGYVLKTKD